MLWPMPSQTNTELCFVTAVPKTKVANGCKHFMPEGHIATNQIPHSSSSLRQTSVGATNNPIKLFREPSRSAALPSWLDGSTYPDHDGIFISFGKVFKPV